ncbi:YdcF family protein [Oryzicola mucosus]|uniref:YdcF family protein n=1 Tax=Oryzicola mucosus TaxID=2767425 RepID=A0A8J6U3B4_9HYPH|nr:YdcF family protein [Oryzicola mucosus]MBD0416323.1 YdcF family protein [Oryzicola mucosus]
MFFYLSKIFWFFAQPLNFVILLLFIGVVAGLLGRRRVFMSCATVALLILVLGVWTSLGAMLMTPLEDRYQRPEPPAAIAGIIVLGGGFEGAINLARGGYELNSGGDRFVETAILARRYPEAKVVVSGGNGSMVLDGEGDADTAPRLLEALGVERGRLVLENRSRNTYENAEFSKQLVAPQPQDTWLLVTSAFHMPRSMALFEKAGFKVTPWPTDYRTSGEEGVGVFADNAIDSIQNVTLGMREWIGLLAYWLSGRIDEPFPGPSDG